MGEHPDAPVLALEADMVAEALWVGSHLDDDASLRGKERLPVGQRHVDAVVAGHAEPATIEVNGLTAQALARLFPAGAEPLRHDGRSLPRQSRHQAPSTSGGGSWCCCRWRTRSEEHTA